MVKKAPKQPATKIIKPREKHNWSEYQKDIFRNIATGTGNTMVIARAGSAKCLGKGTPVLMHDGSIKPVELVKVGDEVMGPDSKPRKVLNTSSGHSNMVQIKPIKGDPWICNDDHVLTLIKSNHGKGQIIDISVKDFIAQNKHLKRLDRNWKLLRTGVYFKEKNINVDPYFVGLWIGDGTKSSANITSVDNEIIEFCKNIAPKYDLQVSIKKSKSKAYSICFRRGENNHTRFNKLVSFYRNNCILNNKKVIPNDYLINSKENRLKLLAGIIDSDGGASNRGAPVANISTISEVLANQYAFLARSLGFAAYISKLKTQIKSINFTSSYYSVNISGDLSEIPTILPRKKFNKRKQIKNHLCTGFDINQLGTGEYFGFTLDGDGRFLLGDFTITHNTSTIVEGSRYIPRGRSSLFCAFNKHIKEELQVRLPHHVQASTLHSIGFQAIRNRFKITTLDNYKCFKLAETVVGSKENLSLIFNICDAVGFCKATLTDVPSKIEELLSDYGIDTAGIDTEEFIKYVILTLRACKEKTNTIDYNDMVYFPFVYRIQPPKFDYVFIDEAQDLNRAQIELALSCVKPGGRTIAVLDNFQCVEENTELDTKSGKVKLKDISIGDYVKSYQNNIVYNKVVNKKISSLYEGYEVITKNNKLSMTFNHRIWANYENLNAHMLCLTESNNKYNLVYTTDLQSLNVNKYWILQVCESKAAVINHIENFYGQENFDNTFDKDKALFFLNLRKQFYDYPHFSNSIESITLGNEKFNLITASGLFPGMKVISNENDQVYGDEIISMKSSFAKFYDIEVESAHNFFGNNILSHNCIYSWAGADSRMFEVLKERLSPTELRLPICYRCPTSVIELAQKIVPDILPWEGSKAGEVNDLVIDDLIKVAKPGDMVISRTNAPLIKNCMKFLKNNIPANMLGRDIGDGLASLIKGSKKKTVKGLLTYLETWKKREISKLTTKNPKANTDFITDKAECIEMLCEHLTTTDEVLNNIDNLFQNGDYTKLVLFSSIHRAKGKESKNVFILADTLKFYNREELNIAYVACTRSKEKLYLVRDPNKSNFSLDQFLGNDYRDDYVDQVIDKVRISHNNARKDSDILGDFMDYENGKKFI